MSQSRDADPSSELSIEESSSLSLDFSKLGKIANLGQDLIPAVAQDIESGAVLIIGYVNPEALEYSKKHGVATFYSTSRDEIWIKGATSGDYLDIVEIRVNCEQNSILYLVRLRKSGSCHTKNPDGSSRYGCFYRKIATNQTSLEFVSPATYLEQGGSK